MVERDLAKVDVAGSTPVSRSKFQRRSPAASEASLSGDKARYPSGKGEVCKTFIRRFDSDPRLQNLTLSKPHNSGLFIMCYQRFVETVLKLCYRLPQ